MLEKILSFLFNTKPQTKGVEQSGLIYDRKATDYVAGTLPYEIKLEDGDWTKYEPENEKQGIPFKFDTMACVSFSFLNSLEAQLEYMIKGGTLPEPHLYFLKSKGYYKNGQVNFSDKFTAIVSGTTKQGNSLIKVADSGRNIGLIPDTLLPFGDEETWDAWHNPAQIKQDMYTLANEFRSYFDIGYEWIFTNEGKELSKAEIALIKKHQKHAPLQIAIPKPGTHAVMLSNYKDDKYRIFNTYPPFGTAQELHKPIHYGMKVVIVPKTVVHGDLTETLRRGSRGPQVKLLQRKIVGLTVDGIFGPGTEAVVKAFQKDNKLTPDGIVGPKTRAVLNRKTRSLVDAIIQVESNGYDNAIGDTNLTDKAYGPMQIRKPCVDDVNRYIGTNWRAEQMLGNRPLSIWVFEAYMDIYATEKALGRKVTDEDRARIWNGGPTGWKRNSTLSYWNKVKQLL